MERSILLFGKIINCLIKSKNMISVIVPIYNAEKYLERCIGSLRIQTYRDIEIILINDGSTDKSSGICDYYASLDNRIKVIHKLNEGVAAARNDGLKIAIGEYVGFVDSDDYIDENMYEQLYLSAHVHNADIVQGGCKRVSLSGSCLYSSKFKNKVVIGRKKCFREHCEKKNVDASSCTKLFKREILGDIDFGGFHHNEDLYFNTQIFFKCKVLIIRNELFYKYVHRPESTVRNVFSRAYEDAVLVNKLLYDMCNKVYPDYSYYFARNIAVQSYNCYRGFDISDFKDKEEQKKKYWIFFKKFFKKSKILLPITTRDSLLILFRICPMFTITLVYRMHQFLKPNYLKI